MQEMPDAFVDLCYIDPPFFTQKDYKNIWGDKESVLDYENVQSLNGFKDTKDFFERHIHSGAKGLNAYLEWMRVRLVEIHRILKPTGSFYCHLDYHAVHYVKVILDEIFGYKLFQNEITWQRKSGRNSGLHVKRWPNNSDTILFYTKADNFQFTEQYINDSANLPHSIKNVYRHDDNDGRGPYQLGPISKLSHNAKACFPFKGYPPPKNGWRWKKERMEEAYHEGILYLPKDKNGQIRQKMYLKDRKGAIIESIWTDIRSVQGGSSEYQGWPTQKPVALLERIIKASSNEGDLVFDCFAGCGTSMHAAHNLKRKWIGIDISPTAVDLIKKRLSSLNIDIEVIENDPIQNSTVA